MCGYTRKMKNTLHFMKSVYGLLSAVLKVSSLLSECTCTNRETEAASSDTHACIIIISDAFNNLSLSFEDNLRGILNLTISFALNSSQTKLC